MTIHSKSDKRPNWREKFSFWIYTETPYWFRFGVMDRYYSVRDFFFPRQRWLKKYTKKSWEDKGTLIPNLLFGCIIHFVEEEKGFEVNRWSNFEIEKNRIENLYQWAKIDRAAFLKKIELAYPPIDDVISQLKKDYTKNDYERQYGEVDRLQAEFDKLDKQYMKDIIDLLDLLWT